MLLLNALFVVIEHDCQQNSQQVEDDKDDERKEKDGGDRRAEVSGEHDVRIVLSCHHNDKVPVGIAQS